MLELGKHLFDGVQVGRVFRQKEQLRAGAADGGADIGSSVAGEVIGNDQVAGPQGRREHLLDIDAEAVSVHWPIEQPRRLDAVTAQRRDEGHRVPVSVWHLAAQACPAWPPAAQRRHVGLGPGLVDKDQAVGVNPRLIRWPLRPTARDVGAILFGSQHGFF